MLNAILIVCFWLATIGASIFIQNILIDNLLKRANFGECIYLHDAKKIYRKVFWSVIVVVSLVTFEFFTLANDMFVSETTALKDVMWFLFMYLMFWAPNVWLYNDESLEVFNKYFMVGTKTIYVHKAVTDEMIERIKNGEDVGKFRQQSAE